MGILPVWGFQMLIAIIVSIYLKLNKALVIIAANVSILPMMPLILYLSHLTGKLWLGEEARDIDFSKALTLEYFYNNSGKLFFQYVCGAVTLAIAAGVTFGFVTYGLLKLAKRKPANAIPAEDRD
jgi:uncharacterized protein (DUF2062 family)